MYNNTKNQKSPSIAKIGKLSPFYLILKHWCVLLPCGVWFLIQPVSRLFSRRSQSEAQRTAAQCSETSRSTGASGQDPHRTRQDQYVQIP